MNDTDAPSPEAQSLIDLGIGGGDRIQRLAVVIPCYHWVSTTFLTNILGLINGNDVDIIVMKGVYTPQAMRHAVKEMLQHYPDAERMLVVEQDMILPRDALLKHSLHTDDIVGSVYFQHAPPYHINCLFRGSDTEAGAKRWGHPAPPMVRDMLRKPALWKCDVVGLGCTSIARRVFEEWPEDIPTFRNDFKQEQADDKFTGGEVSHDVWFCTNARELGYNVYIDTSIVCNHLTEGHVNADHYGMANRAALDTGIVVPRNRAERRHPSRTLVRV